MLAMDRPGVVLVAPPGPLRFQGPILDELRHFCAKWPAIEDLKSISH
jgi:hypothetical protein